MHSNEIAELYSYTEQNEFYLNVKVKGKRIILSIGNRFIKYEIFRFVSFPMNKKIIGF